MNVIVAYFIGTLTGVVATILATRPLKSWKDGYDTAKAYYSDWDKGFEAGWDGAFRQIEKIARAWNDREVDE